jgi:ABC-type polar amino acid transport system ATPase subunit
MIGIFSLCKAFGAKRILHEVSAEVREGSIVSLLGQSGSGKSTLLRCLVALETFDTGRIEIAGFSVGPGASAASVQALRSTVGLVFQDYQLFPHLTALENVTLAPRVVKKMRAADADALGRRWLGRVGLGERASARPSELSGGQKQRVALARALAQGARVLLLDEPTSALDPETRGEVQQVLRELAASGADERPLTILIVTHDMALARTVSDEVWVLENGSLVERGKPAELVANPKSRLNVL